MRIINEARQYATDAFENPVLATLCIADAGMTSLKEANRFGAPYTDAVNSTLRNIGDRPFDFFNHCGNSTLSVAIACGAMSLIPEKRHNWLTAAALGVGVPVLANVTTEVLPKESHNTTPDSVDALYGILVGTFCTAVVIKKMIQRQRRERP